MAATHKNTTKKTKSKAKKPLLLAAKSQDTSSQNSTNSTDNLVNDQTDKVAVNSLVPTQSKTEKWLNRRVPKQIAFVSMTIMVLVVGLLTVATHYSFAQVEVGGIKISARQDRTVLKKQLDNKVLDYRLKVQDETGKVTEYGLQETGLSVDIESSVESAMVAQRPDNLLYRLQWWRKQSVPLVLQADRQKLQAFLDNRLTRPVTAIVDANLRVENDQILITSEVPGEAYTVPSPDDTLTRTISSLSAEPLVLKLQTVTPNILTKDIEFSQRLAASMLAEKITFKIGTRSVTAKPADIAAWLEFSPVPMDKTVDVTVNSGKIVEYINKIALTRSQAPRTQIVMTDPNGVSQVLIRGINGYDIVNKDAVAKEIAQKVVALQDFEANIPVDYTTFQTINAQPRPKWLVANITTKRMYAYENNNLVRTFLISAGSPTYPTVLGEYKINSKVRRQDMRGSNADGSRYFQANVEWVNYFYGSYAIHGNYWRPLSWFGNVNSSHGCIGITNTDGEWIYNWAPVGTPLITHT